MEQRISLITLGAKDLVATGEFYEALGWEAVPSEEGLAVYQLNGQCLGLYGLEALAEDIGVSIDALGHGAATLGYNTRSKEEVDSVLAGAEDAGAKILKPAQDVFWGGYHGYFADPEGHIWEIAFNPFSPLRKEDGAFRWGGGYLEN